MKITIVSGARPNFMKIAPICRAITQAQSHGKAIAFRLVYTGRADDGSLEASLFSDLGLPHPDACLGVCEESHARVTGAIMTAFEEELEHHPAHIVLVVDDLTATMSCAIVAKKRGVKVAHVIAGTRSYDLSMPREVNRTIVDAISDYLFTAGMVASRNLSQEGGERKEVHHVGNVLIDNIRYCRHRLLKPFWLSALHVEPRGYLLLTLNRRDLLARQTTLQALMESLLRQADGLPIVAPVHPYVARALQSLQLPCDSLHLLPPQSYLHFAYLISQARGIVTDSGNIAEEATFLDVPCITLNTYAEHPETWRVGSNELAGEDPILLSALLEKLLKGEWKHASLPDRWDGRAAERIVQTLLNNN
ncbi:MAG: UDP-N-acetyl glucosamine 2-epimerase [Bacteroides sp.]|nr:UDP-N-acetyl glucosamine 2-epimerase [Bacteroides sp.]